MGPPAVAPGSWGKWRLIKVLIWPHALSLPSLLAISHVSSQQTSQLRLKKRDGVRSKETSLVRGMGWWD